MATEKTMAAGKALGDRVMAILRTEHAIDGDDIGNFQKAVKFTWPEMVIEIGEPLPFDPSYIAFEAFEGDAYDPLRDACAGDVRIYCMPIPDAPGMPYIRLKMNRGSPAGTRFSFSEESFLGEVAMEWNGIAERLDEGRKEDGELCDKCDHETLPTKTEDDDGDPDTDEPKFCGNCGAPFAAE